MKLTSPVWRRFAWVSLGLLVVAVAASHAQPSSATMPGASQEVQRLKAENEQLRQQLESLRRQNQELRATLAKASAELAEAAGGTNRPSRAPANAQNKAQPRVPGAGGHGYWLSSSGKRHNSNCRLYGTSRGRPCGASDGAACKLCGG